jgi:hypothetical protein
MVNLERPDSILREGDPAAIRPRRPETHPLDSAGSE